MRAKRKFSGTQVPHVRRRLHVKLRQATLGRQELSRSSNREQVLLVRERLVRAPR